MICNFNPRTPHGVRRDKDLMGARDKYSFQSTHPTRGATSIWLFSTMRSADFNPRTPHGVRPGKALGLPVDKQNFNPRTPHGVRLASHASASLTNVFQSTHPTRGATRIPPTLRFTGLISIHAPHTGCDGFDRCNCLSTAQISIHAPHTGCDLSACISYSLLIISIHAPHTGCDRAYGKRGRQQANFNPRTPHGVRRAMSDTYYNFGYHFNPRTPHGVRPETDIEALIKEAISIHAPHTGCDS